MRLALFVIVAALSTTLAPPARACSYVESTGNVLGVARDGTFVYLADSPENGCCHVQSFSVHDADGAMLLSGHAEGIGNWALENDEQADSRLPRPRQGEDLASFGGRLRKALKLTPLEASSIPVATSNDRDNGACIRFEAYAAGSGSVIDIEPFGYLRCYATRAHLLRHPHSPLWFIAYRDGGRSPMGCSGNVRAVRWVPKGRLKAAALTSNANELARDGRLEQAVRKLTAALEADPGYGLARYALAEQLIAQRVPWSEARKALGLPWPKQLCLVTQNHAWRAAPDGLAELKGFDETAHDAWLDESVSAAKACGGLMW
jgi:hypothetical protein